LGAKRPEDLHRARVGRLLDRHEVARIDQGASDQVEPLLRPVDDQDLFRARLEAEPQQVGREISPQRRIAAGRVVLQQRGALVAASTSILL